MRLRKAIDILRHEPSGVAPRVRTELEYQWNQFVLARPGLKSKVYSREWSKKEPGSGAFVLPTIHWSAGMGHRVSSWIGAYCVAREFDVPLLHRKWADHWDEWLGLDQDRIFHRSEHALAWMPPLRTKPDLETLSAWRNCMEAGISGGRVCRLALDHGAFDQSPAFAELARRYWARHKRLESNQVQVSVHARRGDVTADVASRFRGAEYFKSQLDQVLDFLDRQGKQWLVTIHSNGDPAEFQSLMRPGVKFTAYASEFEEFHAMCSSDVLIASPSSFSVSAGMISGRVVLRPLEWFHAMPAEKRWVGIDNHGQFKSNDLRAALSELPNALCRPWSTMKG